MLLAAGMALLMFAFTAWREHAHTVERREWIEERQRLLDRIMSSSYTEFVTGQRVSEAPNFSRLYLTDEEEAALSRHRGDT